MTLSRIPVSLAVSALAGAAVFAHDDDPKLLTRQAPFLGPGWTPTSGPGSYGPAFDASGVQLLSHVSLGDLNLTLGANDCWGYVSPSGREYAILGTEETTEFIEVTIPTAPALLGGIDGPDGIWRDMKTYGEYCYSVHETNGVGIQVIDLSDIDNGNVTLVNTVEGTDTGYTHNVAIDEESGFLYRTGGSGHGLRIYDLKPDPTTPQYVTTWDDRYVHDAQVVTWSDGRELAFCCGGFNGGWDDTGLTILDVSDKNDIQVVNQLYYDSPGYSHQGWLSEDRQYFYLGDELDEFYSALPTTTHVFDVGDPDTGSYVGSFVNGSLAIGHNMYTHDGKLFQANYRSGLRVFDTGANPTNPAEVAYFDTEPLSDDTDFGGTWSCYPYLPSGIVLLSDRSQGLFVLWVGDETIGTRYCAPAVPNSTGQGASIVAEGSVDVSQNDVELVAYNMPANKFGYFLLSQSQGLIVAPPGSEGNLCLGGKIGRFAKDAKSSGPAGAFSLAIDLNAVPMSPPQAVLPGETWYFTTWYRDNNPGSTSNFTGGVCILFQ